MKQADLKPARSFVGSLAFANGRALSAAASVGAFCLLVSLGAQVRVPVPGTDVPMTLQLPAVLLTGFALTPPRAAAAMLLYLLCGAAGLPVFAPGLAGLAGPAGGYIVGFVAAAWLVSTLKGGSEAGFGRLLVAGAAGTFAVFALGVGARVIWFGGDVRLAVATGLTPFVAKTAVELLFAATLASSVRGWRRDRTRRRALEQSV